MKNKFNPVLVTVKPNLEKINITKSSLQKRIEDAEWERNAGNTSFSLKHKIETLRHKLVQDTCYVECERLFTSKQKLNRFLKFLDKNYNNLEINFKSYKPN